MGRHRARVLGFVPERIQDKLTISGNIGNVQKPITHNILKVTQDSTLGLLINSRRRPRWPPISHFVMILGLNNHEMSLMSLNNMFFCRDKYNTPISCNFD